MIRTATRWIIMTLVISIGLIISSFADDTIATGQCGADGSTITWTIKQEGSEKVLYVNGKGVIKDYGNHDYSFYVYKNMVSEDSDNYSEDITKIVIGEGITEIGERAFIRCPNVKSVVFPKSLTRIGIYAFRYDENIQELKLPENLALIEWGAFGNCSSLQDFTIPASVKRIDAYAFACCDSLREMEVPSTVAEVQGATFYQCLGLEKVTVPNTWTEIPPCFLLGCTKLESFTIPEKVKVIRMGAFQESGLRSIEMPDSVEVIENHPTREQDQWASDVCRDNSGDVGAFWHCSTLKKVKFSKNLKAIGNRTFVGCTSLEEVELPANLTQLGDDRGNWGVFCDCSSLKRITIPRSLKSINEWVFLRCDNLKDLYYEGTESEWKNFVIQPMGNYNYTSTARVHYNCYKEKTFRAEDYHGEENLVIPEGYTRIDEYAFQNAKTLKSVSLPTTLEYIGYYAFQNCTGLTSVTIPGGVKYINRGAFNGCTSLTEVKIANGVTLIGTDSEGKFSGQVKPSGYGSFEGCTSLKTVHIPRSVKSIGEYSFYNCPALSDVYYEGTKEEWANIPIVNGSNQPVITVATKHFNSSAVTVREPNCPSAKFVDVAPGEWYHQYVDFAISHGIMAGISNTKFSPNAEVTRATLVQVLYALENKPAVEITKKFSDVGNSEWYSAAVSWASMNNIVGGYPDGSFRPNKSISRQDMAVMMFAYAKYKGMDTATSASVDSYRDSGKISKYALPALQWAVGKKYMSGTGEKVLSPLGTTTRAQLATVMKAVRS